MLNEGIPHFSKIAFTKRQHPPFSMPRENFQDIHSQELNCFTDYKMLSDNLPFFLTRVQIFGVVTMYEVNNAHFIQSLNRHYDRDNNVFVEVAKHLNQ